MARQSMLIDLTRCIGCDACTVACKQENGTPVDVFFARVLNVEAGVYPNVKRIYIPVLCNHCENPACLQACPNKAIFIRDDGIVLIDQERCRGTGACVSACPYGNIILTEKTNWYLEEDRAYERDFVRPRLKDNVARKCTFCAQRVDQGLKPACVGACPTTARIFGDLDNPESDISRYVAAQKEEMEREPFKLLPEAGTEPANMYLGVMAKQEVSTEGGVAEPPLPTEPPKENAPQRDGAERAEARPTAGVLRTLTVLLFAALLFSSVRSFAQNPTPNAQASEAMEVWGSSSCAGCHGANTMGGLGPPLAETKLDYKQFMEVVRRGKGMMPATPETELSDEETTTIHRQLQATKLDPDLIPISYKIGAMLSTQNVRRLFMVVGILSALLALRVLSVWVDRAGWKQLKPYVRKWGSGKAVAIFLRALIVDGLFVASLYRKDRFRWAMHGLLIYGFLGLWLGDMFMSLLNPTRAQLPLLHPIKILANLGGLAVLAGIVYVRQRYRKDAYIDNGLTIGRDYLFLNLLTVAILSGFLTEALRRLGAVEWVQPVYMLHLVTVIILMISAPYTRFSHAFVVPVLAALTRVTEGLVASGVAPAFLNEPSPGRHHKSERIAAGVLKAIDPEFEGKIRLRYYP